jgi:hypothetical protein
VDRLLDPVCDMTVDIADARDEGEALDTEKAQA